MVKIQDVVMSRQRIKRWVKNFVLIGVFPVYALYLLLIRFSGQDSTFYGFSQAISLVPGIAGIYMRAAFYRLACPNFSDEVSIGFLTILSHRDTSIERGVYIGPQCNIGACTIRKNTLLGSGVHILSGNKQHEFSNPNLPIQEQGGSLRKVDIGEDCWIGNNAVVMGALANHCIVAAGSVVHKDILDQGSILGGNPAVTLKKRELPQ